MNIDDLELLLRALDTGSLARAARELGTTRASASRRLQRLEEIAGGPLLHRSTRGLRLTSRGEEVAALARKIVELKRAILAVEESGEEPQGELVVSVPVVFGQAVMGGFAAHLAARHPKIRLRLRLENRRIDLLQERVDVAIRVGMPSGADLVARRLGSACVACYASGAYLARHGVPGHPRELAGHALLLSDSDELIARRPGSEEPVTVPAHPALRANDRSVLREAAIAGMGVAILPRFMGEHSPALVRVLPEWNLGDYVLSMLYLRESRARVVVRRFAEALSDYLSRHPL
jgi:DNA-binding transcriptional LysR family regulator